MFDGRANIIDIDDKNKTVVFDLYRRKKISGSKLGPILGMPGPVSPFKVACEMAGIYPGDRANKYIDAGNILEPVIRKYVRDNQVPLAAVLGLPAGTPVIVEEPVPKETCGYDHFHDNPIFGGMVDGYLVWGGKRQAVLEIKTSHEREKWLDADCKVTAVPDAYMMQAGLYACLSGLPQILFAVGFLEDTDYARPNAWVPTPENTFLVPKPCPDMAGPMAQAEQWYKDYIEAGETPEWTDADLDVVKYLKAYDPNKKPRNGSYQGRHRH